MPETSSAESEITVLRQEIIELRRALQEKVDRLMNIEKDLKTKSKENQLDFDDIARYSRQLILPGFGVTAQLKLKYCAVLIVGMGGLGCPAAQYLLAAGCGRIGLVDYDEVERSNFHRQTLHTETRIGLPKVESARLALQEINPNCEIDCHEELLNSKNAMEYLRDYDVILDCTDNVATRYLLNDACVMLKKPLISGSALQMDGQLTVYHYGDLGPCYRCIFPIPPLPESVTNCSDSGVLGAVTGVIGALQAMEAIKVLTGLGEVLSGRLLIFDGSRCIFRNLKLRTKRKECEVCSEKPLLTQLIDYEQFCGLPASDKNLALSLIPTNERISVEDYRTRQSLPHLLIDVRSPAEFEICRLPTAQNVPLKNVLDDSCIKSFSTQLEGDTKLPLVLICRRGNDSQIAVQHLRNRLPQYSISDIIGGLHSWHYKIDKNFPIY